MGCTVPIKVKCVEHAVEPVGGAKSTTPILSENFREQILLGHPPNSKPLVLIIQNNTWNPFAGPLAVSCASSNHGGCAFNTTAPHICPDRPYT
jgi:hypothetical protein